MSNPWAREKADELLISILIRSSRKQQRDAIEAVLREAEQRGKSGTTRISWVAEPIEVRRFNDGRDSIIARLQNPDEAMRTAMGHVNYGPAEPDLFGRYCRALAAVLSSPQEENN
jgi:hypothetical protein